MAADGNAAVATGNGAEDTAPQGTAGQTAIAASVGNDAEPQPEAAAQTAPDQPAEDGGLTSDQQPMSKNQQKKQQKMQR